MITGWTFEESMNHTLPQLFAVLKMDSQRRHEDALQTMTAVNASFGDRSHAEKIQNALLKGAGHV